MPADPTKFLTLLRMDDPNGKLDWSAFEQNPEQLFDYIVQFFGIDPQSLDQVSRIYIGPNRPDGDSLWINPTSDKPFIGIPSGGSFIKFYKFPPNAPFVLLNQEHLKHGAVQMTTEEITQYGLPVLTGSAFWAILREDQP